MNNFEYNTSKGAFVLSRSLLESDIWYKSPEYVKIWIYIIGMANHQPRKYRGNFIDRGQYFCSYKELVEQIRYKVGYRKSRVNESTVKNIMRYLRENRMITTVKKPRGVLITVVNYNVYQDLSNYEKSKKDNNEKTNKNPIVNQDAPSINKNEEELKNSRMYMNSHTLNEPEFDDEDATSKFDFHRELDEFDEELKIWILEWAYDEKNNFKIEMSIEDTGSQIENTIRKYGRTKINEIFEYCSEGRIAWDRRRRSTSAYNEFWDRVRDLKQGSNYISNLEYIS